MVSNLYSQSGLISATTSSTVLWNGTSLGLNGTCIGCNGQGESITTTVPASLLAAAGTATITVSSPTAIAIAIQCAASDHLEVDPPGSDALTQISLRNSGPVNTAAVVTLFGTGFTAEDSTGGLERD